MMCNAHNLTPVTARKLLFGAFAAVLLLHSDLRAQVTIANLFNTGQTSSQGLTAGGSAVSFWSVTYASSNGGSSANTTFQGAAYAITASAVSASGYTPSTSTAEWIVAPGASTSSTTTSGSKYVNKGGNYLPGNGTGANEGLFVYTLAFNLTQTGLAVGAVITAPVSIDMTIAADDGYTIYLNPLGYNASPTTAPSNYTNSIISIPQGQWGATSQVIANTSNATFYNGVNYLAIVVDNTNGISGSSSSTAWNETGLLDYNMSAWNGTTEIWANGAAVVPVPEVGTWIPGLFGVLLAGYTQLRRRLKAA